MPGVSKDDVELDGMLTPISADTGVNNHDEESTEAVHHIIAAPICPIIASRSLRRNENPHPSHSKQLHDR